MRNKKHKRNRIPILNSETLKKWILIIDNDDHYAISAPDAERWASAYTEYVQWYRIVEENGMYTRDGLLSFGAYCLRDAQNVLRDIESEIGFKPLNWDEVRIEPQH